MTEQALKNIQILGKPRSWIDTEINTWQYNIESRDDSAERKKTKSLPFIDYVLEDKSSYPFANTMINKKLNVNWSDPDNDFKIGKSGGLLMNIDFVFVNTAIFSRTSDYFTNNGRYCPYEEGTSKASEWWDRETRRRRKGVEARCKLYHKDIDEYYDPTTTEERKKELLHYVKITGDHYNYLNYGVIERTPTLEEENELIKEGRIQVKTLPGRPRFWDADYWYFKVDQFIILNKKNLCLAKARRKGVSYKRASQSANRVNLNKAVTVVLAADILDYLTDSEATADMAKKNLDHYEVNTYWKRGYLSESLDYLVLGYKIKKEGN